MGKKRASKANRAGGAERLRDPAVPKSVAVDLALSDFYDPLLRDRELISVRTAKQHDAQTLYRLQAIPGIGKIVRVVLLYASHAITRCPRGQDFVSSCRLVKCAKAAAGKRYGTAGPKIGHAYLQWAFSDAAVLCLRTNPAGQKYLARLEKKHGKGKALTVRAHKLARAGYSMWKREVGCDLATLLQTSGRGVGEPAADLGHEGLSLATVLCEDAPIASPNAHEHRGTWPCPCAFDWPPPLALVPLVEVPDG